MSTSLCRLQKASCLAEELLDPCCRRGPCLALVCQYNNNHQLICLNFPYTVTGKTKLCHKKIMHLENHAVRLPSVISIGVLLPLSHLHVAHRPRRASVILFSHSTVGTWLHELLSSFKFF